MEDKNEEFYNLYDLIKNRNIHEIISNSEKLNDIKLKFQSLNEEDIIICLYLVIIDCKNSKCVNELNNYYTKEINKNNKVENDILNNIYRRKLLDKHRFKKLISMFIQDGIHLKINVNLLNLLIRNNDIELLNIIYNNIFYDNNFIKSMLHAYKFKIGHSDKIMKNIYNNEINKFCFNQLNREQKYRILALASKNKYEDLMKTFIINDITIENGKKYYPFIYASNKNNYDNENINQDDDDDDDDDDD